VTRITAPDEIDAELEDPQPAPPHAAGDGALALGSSRAVVDSTFASLLALLAESTVHVHVNPAFVRGATVVCGIDDSLMEASEVPLNPP